MRAALLLILSPLLAREKAAEYPAHVSLPGVEIGAEYLVHSIPTEKGFYIANDYLVVEVGIFPSTAEKIKISSGQFILRINHGKSELVTDSPGTVAASIKYPDWEQHRTVTAQAGPVIVGAPPQVGRFPGDPQERPPVIPPPQESPDPAGNGPAPTKTIEEMIAQAALPEWPANKPVSGCLFFHFRGKMKSVRSLELVYDGGDGRPKATIPLL